jgi:hypothetical protein
LKITAHPDRRLPVAEIVPQSNYAFAFVGVLRLFDFDIPAELIAFESNLSLLR